MKTVYIGLGSNIDNPVMQIHEAVERIKETPGVVFKRLSNLYQSTPLGPQDQPDFVNAVAEIETNLSARGLLAFLQRIEDTQKRDRSAERWGPRTIDLDILLFGDERVESSDLSIPHVGLKERAFVVYPLSEIAPQLTLPGGETISDLKAQCPAGKLKLLEPGQVEEMQ